MRRMSRPLLLRCGVIVLIATCGPAGPAAAAPTGRQLCGMAKYHLHKGGRAVGLFIADAGSGKVLCRDGARRPRILASNTKIFTTGAALARAGKGTRIATTVWARGEIGGGVLRGDLYLVGAGDPVLATPSFGAEHLAGLDTDITALAAAVREIGIKRITGRVLGDETIFDRLRGVADSGYGTSIYIGPLSGLSINLGYANAGATSFADDPALVAVDKLAKALRKRGIAIGRGIGLAKLPRDRSPRRLTAVRSPPIEELVESTNEYSLNFFAEMLLKWVGARYGNAGSTAAGAAVVESFARNHGSAIHAVDGSGLSRGNRASPAAVGRFLIAMRETDVGTTFIGSLATAGREGTVSGRMIGTAAEGRCQTKTGTIDGVSTLSGYCSNRSHRVIVFSILMNGVSDLSSAHDRQDKIAGLVAQY